MPNPNINQGVLNRVKASVTWTDQTLQYLNITAPYLGKEGIRLALEGNAADYFGSMTGAVPSPVPYQIATLTINLLKSQQYSNAYKTQFEYTTLMGQCTVTPDVPQLNAQGLGTYILWNCVLESVREMTFAGEDPLWVVTIKGYYEVNSQMFDT